MALVVEQRGGLEGTAAMRSETRTETLPGTKRRGARLLRLALCLIGCLMLAIVGGFGFFLASLDRLEHLPPTSTDGMVALTGGSQRIGDAIDLLAQGFARRLLITGVNERTSREEIARLNPEKRALVECCVDLDYRARNTVGNALETRHWAVRNGFRSLIVVTSNYHMPRTLAELDHALPGMRKVPFAVVSGGEGMPWWHRLGSAKLLVSEYAKYVAVLARTRMSAAWADEAPAPGQGPGTGYEGARLVANPGAAR
jgi:uncharacterized SAM-binding protein YcdF (DUF218 family)